MNNSKNCWSLYCHTTPSGKRYIGITSRKPEERWKNGYGYKNTLFGKAIEKYKWENIQHNIVSTDLTEKEAKWLENYLICYYRTFVGFKDCKGYNMTLGGEGTLGYVQTEESRRKNSEAHKGQISGMKGKHHTKESKEKMSESSKGITAWNKGKTGVQVAWNKEKPLSEEHKRKIGESHKGKTPWNKGLKQSEEHRIKNSESHKGKIPWNRGKKMKPHTEEEKKKMSESHIGKHWKLIDGKRVYYE